MIRYLRGLLVEKNRNQVVVDVQGVGYDLFVTPKTLTHYAMGDEGVFYVSESIREDGHDLYGFLSPAEREGFELLRKVSGVGPKVALAITGFYTNSDLQSIIASADSTKLSLVPGVGKKLASKIIVELKDKATLNTQEMLAHAGDETVEALQSLGYTPSEIAQLLPKVPSEITSTSEKITWILRHVNH